jgi:hypothetical protein
MHNSNSNSFSSRFSILFEPTAADTDTTIIIRSPEPYIVCASGPDAITISRAKPQESQAAVSNAVVKTKSSETMADAAERTNTDAANIAAPMLDKTDTPSQGRAALPVSDEVKLAIPKFLEIPETIATPAVVTEQSAALIETFTPWPQIGAEGIVLETAPLLASEEYRQAYRPGLKREIYIAGCEGLAGLKAVLNIPVFKIGECGAGNIDERIQQLGTDKYGAAWKNGKTPVIENGYDKYTTMQLHAHAVRSKHGPVKYTPRGLIVTLPEGMTTSEFSDKFLEKMASGSWLNWCETEEAAKHFAKRGIDAARAKRFTPFQAGSKQTLRRAQEFYCIRNNDKTDLQRLVAVIENVILEYLKLI